MIQVGDNFDHKSKKPLDARTSYATLALMKAVADANINEGCLAYCAETDKYYKFLSTNTVDADTGKWREFSSGGGGTSDYSDLENKPSIESVTLSGNKTASDLGLAKSSDIPTKVSQLTNDSGYLTSVSKSDVGLGNVVNTGDSDTPTNGGTTKFTTGGAYTLKQSIDKAYKSDDTTESSLADADTIPFYDNSASAKRKTLWSNVKLLLKSYFDGFYQYVITAGTGLSKSSNTLGIKPFVSGDMDDIVTPLPSSASKYMNYSTEEQVVGQWVDGSTVYQKTFTGTLTNCTTAGTAVDTTIDVGSTFSLISANGCTIASSGARQLLPAIKLGSSNQYVSVSTNGSNLYLKNAWYTSGTNTYVITIQYTKTT